MEIKNNGKFLQLESDNKSIISLDKENLTLKIDDFDVSYPWEYEKSGILLEVKEYEEKLFYSFSVDSKHILFVLTDTFELKEEILSFFWDVDILFLISWKNSVKIYENIEARVVVPFWEAKDIFLQNLWQKKEELSSYKIKWDLPTDTTEFINLVD